MSHSPLSRKVQKKERRPKNEPGIPTIAQRAAGGSVPHGGDTKKSGDRNHRSRNIPGKGPTGYFVSSAGPPPKGY